MIYDIILLYYQKDIESTFSLTIKRRYYLQTLTGPAITPVKHSKLNFLYHIILLYIMALDHETRDIITNYNINPNEDNKGKILEIVRDNPKILDNEYFINSMFLKKAGMKLYLIELVNGFIPEKNMNKMCIPCHIPTFVDNIKCTIAPKLAYRLVCHVSFRGNEELMKKITASKYFDMKSIVNWDKKHSSFFIRKLLAYGVKYPPELMYYSIKYNFATTLFLRACIEIDGYFMINNVRMTSLHYAIIENKKRYINFFKDIGEDMTQPIYIDNIRYSLPEYLEKNGKTITKEIYQEYDYKKSVSPIIDNILLNNNEQDISPEIIMTMLIKLGPQVMKKYNLKLDKLQIIDTLRHDMSPLPHYH